MTPSRFLASAADALETSAGVETHANRTRGGYWKRIALAVESGTGFSSEANANITGWMLRAAAALESVSGTSGEEENSNYNGLLKRVVDALEQIAGTVGDGSLGRRLALAAAQVVFEDEDATALFAAMTVEPSPERKKLINNLIVALKSSGVWGTLDGFYMLAAHDAQAARINWKDPLSVAIPVNSPVFTVDKGYAGDGASSCVDTGFNPVTAGGHYQLNSAHLGVWALSDASDGQFRDLGSFPNRYLNSRSGSNMVSRLNSDALTTALPAQTSIGHSVASRSGATTRQHYKNAVLIGGDTAATDALANSSITIGSAGTSYSPRQIAGAHFGGSLTPEQVSDLHNALNTYLTTIGAA